MAFSLWRGFRWRSWVKPHGGKQKFISASIAELWLDSSIGWETYVSLTDVRQLGYYSSAHAQERRALRTPHRPSGSFPACVLLAEMQRRAVSNSRLLPAPRVIVLQGSCYCLEMLWTDMLNGTASKRLRVSPSLVRTGGLFVERSRVGCSGRRPLRYWC